MPKHPGSIDRHGPSWRVRLSVRGERYAFMLEPGATKDDAVQFAFEKAAELRRGTGGALPGPMPFSELMARYRESRLIDLSPRSQTTYTTSLRAFKTYFVTAGGDPDVSEIGRGTINAFMDWRRRHSPDGTLLKTPLTAGSIRNDRMRLHGIFTFAADLEIVERNPVSKTKPPKGDARNPAILSSDQYEALLTACEGRPMLYMYVLTLGESGLRCDSECLWLRWEDVDLERGFLAIESGRHGHRTKSGKSRKVPMTARLRDALRDHMASYRMRTYRGERCPWVFHHTSGPVWGGNRIVSQRRPFMKAVARAGSPDGFVQHDLRHRRVTTWLAEGKSPALVQKAMGHADLATTMAYSHLVDSDLLALVEAPERSTGTGW